MPTTPTKGNRRGGPEMDRNRKNRLTAKASSFHGKLPADIPEARIRRPKTLPDLLAVRNHPATVPEVRPKLTKVLVNVTVQGSVGAVQVLMSPESTVGELIAATIQQYTKEGRRPVIPNDSSRLDLHYSQFSLESNDPLINHALIFDSSERWTRVQWRLMDAFIFWQVWTGRRK